MVFLPKEPPIDQQVRYRRRLLPRLLVQPREVEVGVRQPPIGGDRLLVGLHRVVRTPPVFQRDAERSEEHTSELQSRLHLVCRLLLEKKKKIYPSYIFMQNLYHKQQKPIV